MKYREQILLIAQTFESVVTCVHKSVIGQANPITNENCGARYIVTNGKFTTHEL